MAGHVQQNREGYFSRVRREREKREEILVGHRLTTIYRSIRQAFFPRDTPCGDPAYAIIPLCRLHPIEHETHEL